MLLEKTLRKFNITDTGIRLAGGQQTTMKFGDIVLKPIDDVAYANFTASIFDQIDPKEYRISKPIKSIDNNYVEDGFIATKFEPGNHDFSRIAEMLKVSENLHHDLKEIKCKFPNFDNPWTSAQKILWDNKKLPIDLNQDSKEFCEKILAELKPITLPKQLIHSDLSGNILFHENLKPLVIDFSPAFAPYEYASALIVTDNIAWNHADINSLELLKEYSIDFEVVKYAVVFRILVSALLNKDNFAALQSDWNNFKDIWEYITR
jgi:uncharacterized protein (TIGR02569 family)